MQTSQILIKRYARSRLYHPAAGGYVSRDELRRWSGAGIAFAVRDTEAEADAPRVLLA